MKRKSGTGNRLADGRRAMVWLLAAALLLQAGLPVEAAQTLPTYEEYRAGGREAADESAYIQILISTEEELAQLAQDCRLDSYSADKLVKLENDILLEDYRDLSIPNFGGIFEGNGHKISNLLLEEAGSAVGFFRYVQEGGKVRNLTVQGRVEPTGSRSRVGGIAGVNYGVITACTFDGLVSGDTQVGGIAGSNPAGGQIRKCQNNATVSGNHSTGGIVGDNSGTVSQCRNLGEVNTYDQEVYYELEDITIDRLEDINSTSNVSAHTDTGGIAGITYGKLYACANYGNVGYAHVGYNVGGVAGRVSQGYLSGCANYGTVLGRKDVGGITGQMEPFLEVAYMTDKLQELDRETDKLFELIDESREDLSRYGDQAADQMRDLSGHLHQAVETGGYLMDMAEELWYVYNQELSGIGDDFRDLEKSLGGEGVDERHPGTGDGVDIGSAIGGVESYLAALKKFNGSTGKHIQRMTRETDNRSGDISDNLDLLNSELEQSGEAMDRLTDVLDAGASSADSHLDEVSAQIKVVRSLVQGIRDDLFSYEGITVEDASEESAGAASRTLPSEEELSMEADLEEYYDTESFRKGKIEGCCNEGSVEADTAVGGIVGQIAIEYDLDPEDDLNYSGEESFHIERSVKAVVRDSLNRGTVTGKRDYVGGIVGRAEFGVIISCESYGDVCSTGGSQVGGVAGASRYAIRSCYSLGRLAGKNQVGGIVGKGCDVFYSYAYNRLEVSGECCGSVAGMLEEEGTLFGNYYVENGRGGVDGIGYQGGATPLRYEEFCARQEVPEAFSKFRIVFRAQEQELGAVECGYGESVDPERIPDIPEREGYYGVWPEADLDFVTDNLELEAEYVRWLGSLEGGERNADGRSLILAEGQFLPGAVLETQAQGDAVRLTIRQPVFAKGRIGEAYEEYARPVTVRLLCEDAGNAKVEVERDGVFVPADTRVMGSYVVFSMDRPGTFRMTEAENHGMMIGMAAAGAVLAAAALAAVLMIRRRKKRRGKPSAAEAQTQDAGEERRADDEGRQEA
ncbi:MAG: hypothetical protein NC417_03155 [Candidatus Gastranaerophilales bacterium]|nr:hypothetical protein [Candidatus Gastranaerophilales bacterium]